MRRVSDGLGLAAIIGLVACSTSPEGSTSAEGRGSGAGNQPPPSSTSTETSPTDPADPATTTTPPDPASPETPPAPIASGITISAVAMFQGVKVPVMDDGALVKTSARKAPVVANRQGMLRVYVTPDAGWKPTNVTAELRLVSGDKKFPVIRDTKSIANASKEEDPASTLNLDVPADSLPQDVTFQVSLTTADATGDASARTDQPARFPRDGSTETLGTEASGTVRIVVVPVKYDNDGSGRIPSVTDAQLDAYKQDLMRFYPAERIEVKAHAPYEWKDAISNNGGGFSSILRAITQLRADDKVDPDVYYYGLLTPKATMAAYCGGGCVTGLSSIVDTPSAAGMRASVGIGFEGIISANTMVHEVGHAHGRQHAPCGGPASPDPQFPYSGGGIGSWGYDIFAKALISPSTGKDVMGYCQNLWISDYNYNAIFERIVAIRQSASVAPPYAARKEPSRYRVATSNGAGELTWDGELDLDDDQIAGTTKLQAKFLADKGDIVLNRTAHFFPFDHLPGGFVVVPKEPASEKAAWKSLKIDGYSEIAR